jgi:hypothetical protein
MSQVPIWFERKFEFSFPLELLPNLRARLRGTPARLEDALRGRSHKILIQKAQEKWSAQEHAGHLLDLEPLWLARVGDYVAAAPNSRWPTCRIERPKKPTTTRAPWNRF